MMVESKYRERDRDESTDPGHHQIGVPIHWGSSTMTVGGDRDAGGRDQILHDGLEGQVIVGERRFEGDRRSTMPR